MIDEKKLAGFTDAADWVDNCVEIEVTMKALWKVARAARRWTKALQGHPSIEAEAELVVALDELKEPNDSSH